MPVYRSLRFKIAAAFLLAALVLALTTVAVIHLLARHHSADHAASEQRESDLRLAQDMRRPLDRALILANTLANLVLHGDPASWSDQVQLLARGSQMEPMLAAVGIWPEPDARASNGGRSTHYWLVETDGSIRPRTDYNDPSVIAYHEESWYTPARFLPPGRCYWTPVYREFLSKLDVVTCALALRQDKRFAGVVTVSLRVEALNQGLREAALAQSGYSMLVDRDNRLIAAGGLAVGKFGNQRPRNLAELAHQLPDFNPLALAVHRLDQAFLGRPDSATPRNPQQITALNEMTRNFSRQESESALSLIRALPEQSGRITALPETIRIERDAFLDEPSIARVLMLDDAHWKLVRVTNASEATGAADGLLTRATLISLAAIALSLLIAYAGVDRLILHPLAAMKRRLAVARTTEDAALVDWTESANDEIGEIGRACQERVFELRDLAGQISTLQSRLDSESAKRGRSSEQSLRRQESLAAVLADIDEAVILVDENGLIEGMNAVAEQLCASSLAAVRGKTLTAALRVRIGPSRDEPFPDFAQAAMKSRIRVQHAAGVFVQSEDLAECEVRIAATPLFNAEQLLGAVLVFSPCDPLSLSDDAEPADQSAQAGLSVETADAAIWGRRIRAGLELGLLHLTTQWIQPPHLRAGEGAVYSVSVALEDEEGFWTESASFMDMAQKQSLAAAVDGWTLSRTVESLARDSELLSRVAFCLLELSASSVLDGSLLDTLARLLQQNEGVPPDKLCFAIDRQVLDSGGAALSNFCATLRGMGCRVALDHELGGNLADRDRLRRIPADIHCIDAGRHPDVAGDALDQTLAEALVRAARILDRRVLVRHLASENEAEAWRRRGADYLQGPAVARTSPVVFSQPEDTVGKSVVVPFTNAFKGPRSVRSAVPAPRYPASG